MKKKYLILPILSTVLLAPAFLDYRCCGCRFSQSNCCLQMWTNQLKNRLKRIWRKKVRKRRTKNEPRLASKASCHGGDAS